MSHVQELKSIFSTAKLVLNTLLVISVPKTTGHALFYTEEDCIAFTLKCLVFTVMENKNVASNAIVV